MRVRRRASLSAAAALAAALCGCQTVTSPTYTSERLTLRGCPGGVVHTHGKRKFTFTVVNRSSHRWAAAYVLVQPHGPIQTAVSLPAHSQAGGIGGYVTRAAGGLAAGKALSGTINAALNETSAGSFKLGAWGAPANSVKVPNSFTARFCRLVP